MKKLYGQHFGPLIIIHGGASPIDPKGNALKSAIASLENMASLCMNELKSGKSAIKTVSKCLEMLENDEQFNASFFSFCKQIKRF